MSTGVRGLAAKALGPPALDESLIVHKLFRRATPVMIDVGAHVGGSLLPFAASGWDVHAFEPDPHNRELLLRATADLPKVRVNASAVSTIDGEKVPLYTSEVSSGISTLQPFHPSHRATSVAITTRLDTYLRENDVSDVGFLKVDAEGHDLPVLESFPWSSCHPMAVLCEFEDRKTVPLGHTYRETASFLAARGYAVIVSEWHPVVEYGRHHRWRRVRGYPVDLSDQAWGNLLAVAPADASRARRALRRAGLRLRVRGLADRFA